MERTDVLELMSRLKLYGMRAAYDEVMTIGIKRRHEPPRIVGDLLSAEIAEKQARSIKYQLTIAKLPLAKDIDDFDFTGTPVNEAQIRDLASGAFLAEQRNARVGRGNRHRQVASRHSHRASLHPRRRPWPFLYRRRPRQPAGGRSPLRPSGPPRRISGSRTQRYVKRHDPARRGAEIRRLREVSSPRLSV
jgi:IstB-like ATP binding protein